MFIGGMLMLVDWLVKEGRPGILALAGEMLLSIDGKTVLIKAPGKKLGKGNG
ncbi:MAG: hypothetical protein ABR568_10360 [Pyrinomonadaceae bacterium]